MLYKLHTNFLVIGLLTVGLMAAKASGRAFNLLSLASVFAYCMHIGLILYFSRAAATVFTEKILFFTVLIYSFTMVALFMNLSLYYCDDTFMFSKADAMVYSGISMRVVDVGLFANILYILSTFGLPDSGALIYDSILMSILPEKLFLNFTYVIYGALSSILLFRIGKHFISDSYAFLAALAYGTSSYLIFFHCTWLKESLFVFLVICTMYYFYQFLYEGRFWVAFRVILCLSVLITFRPAVAAFLAMGMVSYYAITKRGSAMSLFLYMIVAVMFAVAMKGMMEQVDEYSKGGDVKLEQSEQGQNYSGGFSFFVNIFGGFFGPFPTFFTKTEGIMPTTINFYASGLTYKLFLVLPFWLGVFYAWKNKLIDMLPMLIFILVEMLATGMVYASLELRKVLVHMPFMYIVSFYGLSLFPNLKTKRHMFETSMYSIAVGILILWNLIKI